MGWCLAPPCFVFSLLLFLKLRSGEYRSHICERARSCEKSRRTVTIKERMCPKLREKQKNGHIQGGNVPEVGRKAEERSHSRRERARSWEKSRRTVTIKERMCPKSREKQRNGHIQVGNVPEVGGKTEERSHSRGERARSRGKNRGTVTFR